MADLEDVKVARDYHVDVSFASNDGFYVKEANNLDWGMEEHSSNIFDPKGGNTVVFVFDRRYFMGSTAELKRLDLVVPKLIPHVDVLMGTRGALRSCVAPACGKDVALRSTSGSSMLNDNLSHEILTVGIEDAIRMNADCMAIRIFIDIDGQLSNTENLSKTISLGMRYSIPTTGVVAVGEQMERTGRFFELATRVVTEMGANIIRTYYCENFEEVVAAYPAPIVVIGGKKLPEKEALTLAYNAISDEAHDVNMGRNIFQSIHSLEIAVVVGRVVHEEFMNKETYKFFKDAIHQKYTWDVLSGRYAEELIQKELIQKGRLYFLPASNL